MRTTYDTRCEWIDGEDGIEVDKEKGRRGRMFSERGCLQKQKREKTYDAREDASGS